jgi:hypothetical protein
MNVRRLPLTLVALGLPLTSAAQEQRHLTVASGQQLDAEIVATEDSGFRVRLAQGELMLPFEAVVGFDELPAGRTTLFNTPWQVLLLVDPAAPPLADGPTAISVARTVFASIPDVRVQLLSDLEPTVRERVQACALDVVCVAKQLPAGGWTFVTRIAGDATGLDYATVSPLDVSEGVGTRGGRVAASTPDDAFFTQLRASLGLVDVVRPAADVQSRLAALWPAPEPEPVVVVEPPVLAPVTVPPIQPVAPPPPTPEPEEDVAVATERPDPEDEDAPSAARRPPSSRDALWSLVPFPGLAAAKDGRWGAFGGAVATTAVMGTGWVALSGNFSTKKAEHVGLAVAGTYVLSVASSELFRQVGADRVVLAPTPLAGRRGVEGVALTIGGRF